MVCANGEVRRVKICKRHTSKDLRILRISGPKCHVARKPRGCSGPSSQSLLQKRLTSRIGGRAPHVATCQHVGFHFTVLFHLNSSRMMQLRWLLFGLCAFGLAYMNQCAQAVEERFESAEVSWKLVDSDSSAQILAHERVFTAAHSGQGCEHVRLGVGQGTYAYLAHKVEPSRIIGELAPSLWVKADRPGIRLMVRVVLPRSKDREGKTLTVLLEGDYYTQVSTWQRLEVRDLKKLLDAEVRIRRRQLGQVDEREAYLDHFVLNAYGGPGVTQLWLDDLELSGFASSQPIPTSLEMTSESGVEMIRTPSPQVTAVEAAAELRGSLLLVENRPFFAKIIEHNGEPFTWLKDVGFNTLLLRHPPSPAQLAEAERADLWLITPPPISNGVMSLAPAHRRVIAWLLGSEATLADLDAIANLASQVRRQDVAQQRPIMCDVAAGWADYGRVVDVLLLSRPTLGTSFDQQHYGDWLRSAMHGIPGQPVFGAVPTEPSKRLLEQLALGQTGAAPTRWKSSADPEQIRMLAVETVAVGARGVCFRSRSRLDLDDDVAKLRAASLRWINSELSLLAPWAAGGSFVEQFEVGDSLTRVRVLETERSQLLIVTRHAAQQQYVPQPRSPGPISFAAHGAPITDQAYHLAPQGLQPLLGSRAGQLRVTLAEPDTVSLVLVTQDPLVINRVTRELSANRQPSTALRHELASLQLRHTQQVLARLEPRERADRFLEEARFALERGEQLLRTGDTKNALLATVQGHDLIRRVQRHAWEEAVLLFPSPASSPLCASFATLPLHAQASNHLSAGAWSDNLLRAGDCESLELMLRSGWRQSAAAELAANTLVELSLHAPAGGRSALRLAYRVPTGAALPSEDWPVRVTSGPMSVVPGQVLRIHGWVKVPEKIRGTRDGLLIFDSLSGVELAERVEVTEGWREFTLYRIATREDELTLTFALTGYGEAWVDEVSVTTLQLPPRE